jgi:hypothetical protein
MWVMMPSPRTSLSIPSVVAGVAFSRAVRDDHCHESRWCASGTAVDAPKPEVTYSATQVTLTIWGTPPGGNSFSCQANPTIELTVPLTEPLGNRKVVQGATELR